MMSFVSHALTNGSAAVWMEIKHLNFWRKKNEKCAPMYWIFMFVSK